MSEMVPRKTREERAFRLVVAGGGFGVLAVIGFVLAFVSSFSFFWPFLAAIIALGCGYLFRRATGQG